jgi:hypothetical protein
MARGWLALSAMSALAACTQAPSQERGLRTKGADAGPSASALASGTPQESWKPPSWEQHLKRIEDYVERLKGPALVGDRLGFAQLLHYPFRVNTRSRCVAEIPNADVFISHYPAIVTTRVQRAILAAQPPIRATFRGSMLGLGEIWMNEVDPNTGAVAVTAVNSPIWRIPDLPCKDETNRPLPDSLGGRWSVTSFCDMGQAQMTPRSRETWRGRSVAMDLGAGRAVLALEPGPPVVCAIGRYGERLPSGDSGRPGLGAERCGLLGDDSRGFFLDLECRYHNGRQYIERIDVLSEKSIAIVGDDKWLLILSSQVKR